MGERDCEHERGRQRHLAGDGSFPVYPNFNYRLNPGAQKLRTWVQTHRSWT